MSRPRYARPDDQGTRDHDLRRHPRPLGLDAPARSPWTHRPGVARLVSGIGLALVMLLLGELAKVAAVARLNLRADQHVARDRTRTLTSLAKAASDVATPETIGIGLIIVVPVVLLLLRRRLDAAKALCVLGGAFALAETGKKLVNEPRPPVALQAMAAGASGSFPSGHTTTAAALAVALAVIAATITWRAVALILGGLYTVAVAASRVYLGDHYPLDVLGGMICAIAAGMVVSGLFALPAAQPYLRRLRLTVPAGRHR